MTFMGFQGPQWQRQSVVRPEAPRAAEESEEGTPPETLRWGAA
jgi:hypothetical protein